MLPGLAPHHTRQSFCSGTRLYIENTVESPADFMQTSEGLWLLPESVAERDRLAGKLKLGELAAHQSREGMHGMAETNAWASDVLATTDITDTGCMVEGLDDEDFMSASEFMLYLAGAEWRSPPLDEVEDVPHLQICETDDCYNTRHFDLDFSKFSIRSRMTELNPLWYETTEDGEVKTIWGDSLATLDESMRLYIKLQQMSFPHIPFKESLLTPSGISQVRFHPLTGCWETWMYNIKPDGSKGGRFEGYGNLYYRYRSATVDAETGEIVGQKRRGHWLAHRIMWQVTGQELERDKVLNHLCNYKRCCNPLHLEQIPEEANKVHGQNAREYIREIERQNPSAREYYMGAEEMAVLYKDARKLYEATA